MKVLVLLLTLCALVACGSGINGPFEVWGYTAATPPPPPLPPEPPPVLPPELPPGSYTLDFDSLPSDQGWRYQGGPLAEDDAFSVDGTRLTQMMVGSGTESTTGYWLPGAVSPDMEMTLSLSARVVGYEDFSGSVSLGFVFRISNGRYGYSLGFTDDLVAVHDQFLPLDTTISHDYVMEMHPDGGFDLSVDGDLLATGVGYDSPSSSISFGDRSNLENLDAEVTALSLTVALNQVSIAIKPSSDLNSINPDSKESIPVAILTTNSFDAVQVDWETVRFGPTGATESHGLSHVEDVDNDGDTDLIFHFNTRDTGIKCDDSKATLTGATFSGESITASDMIKPKSCP